MESVLVYLLTPVLPATLIYLQHVPQPIEPYFYILNSMFIIWNEFTTFITIVERVSAWLLTFSIHSMKPDLPWISFSISYRIRVSWITVYINIIRVQVGCCQWGIGNVYTKSCTSIYSVVIPIHLNREMASVYTSLTTKLIYTVHTDAWS